MGRLLVCALFVCLLPAGAGATSGQFGEQFGATSEQLPAFAEFSAEVAGLPTGHPELAAENTSFAYRVRHGAQPLPEAAFDALWFGGDEQAPPRVAVAEPVVQAPSMTVGHVPSRSALCGHAALLAAEHDLPVPFFANLIQQESGFRSHVVSPAGAQGIAQFMPRVARAYGLENPFDPLHSMAVSAKFLRELLGQFGNLGLAAAAYNAGPKRVQDWMNRRGKLPEETRNYVQNITGLPAERWARVKAPTEDKTLPAHARCPGMPSIEVSVPTPAPVKTAKNRSKGSGKAAQVAAKSPKGKKAYTLATIASSRKAVIKDGKVKILADDKAGKKTKSRSAAKLAKSAARKQTKSESANSSKRKVKIADAR